MKKNIVKVIVLLITMMIVMSFYFYKTDYVVLEPVKGDTQIDQLLLNHTTSFSLDTLVDEEVVGFYILVPLESKLHMYNKVNEKWHHTTNYFAYMIGLIRLKDFESNEQRLLFVDADGQVIKGIVVSRSHVDFTSLDTNAFYGIKTKFYIDSISKDVSIGD